jgi:hypothetical protein
MEELVLCETCWVYYNPIHVAAHELSEVHHRHAVRDQIGGGGGRVPTILEIESAVRNRLKTYWVSGGESHTDLVTFLDEIKNLLNEKIRDNLQNTALKINILVRVKFQKEATELEEQNRCFKTKNVRVLQADDVDGILDRLFGKLLKEKSESSSKGSGWSLREILGLELRVNRYRPLRGSSYIELPPKIAQTHSVINVQNKDDDFCFKYAIWAKNIDGNPQRVSKYNTQSFRAGYDWDCISHPVEISKIVIFERKNNISINVFGLDERDNVYPIKIVNEELEDHRDLLYLVEGNKSHYCYIRNFDKLVKSQMTKHKSKLYFCKRCLKHCYSLESLREHKEDCARNFPSKIILPEGDDAFLKFKNFSHTARLPYVAYADFECVLPKITSCSPQNEHSYTEAHQQHEAMSFCLLLVGNTGEVFEPILYRGENAVQVFLEKLKEMALFVRGVYKSPKPMNTLTDEEILTYNEASLCHICGLELGEDRVRDHDHLSGKFRGAAHMACNVNCKVPYFLPVFIHNLSNYDAHLIVPHLGYDDIKITCIPNNEEKYISFAKYVDSYFSYRFVDSFRFLSTSLSKLVDTLPKDAFKQTSRIFKDKLDLVTRKGVFPYEYVNSWEKLNDASLPSIEQFFSTLTEDTITSEDYEFATKVWTEFDCKTLGEYSDLYLKTDVLLLADVFENFRSSCMNTYGLDPAWYFTIPGLSFDAMLKHTAVTLELLTDYDMILMFEKGIRGGISQCVKRYAEANNKFVEGYDSNKESTYLAYVDANNLYGWALSEYLPTGGFRWIDEVDVMTIPDDSPKGYLLEVDLAYPTELHDLHSDLPFCSETKTPPGGKHSKLLTTLDDKERYVIHYRALKQALTADLKLKKIHRVIEFDQSPWMKSYIDLNSEKRKLAKYDFDKEMYKLFNNSVFGKTMENVRNRINIELVNNEKRLNKVISSSLFLDRTIFAENLVAVHSRRSSIKMSKPLYIGQAVLDLSKVLMYDFFYGHLKNKDVSLLYMDTDSFILEMRDDFYKDVKENSSLYDTSNYPADHPCYSITNAKLIGKMKDECGGKIMTHFVGLRSKLYSYRVQGGGVGKRAKGVKKVTIDKTISFEDYVHCLRENTLAFRKMTLIRSQKHQLRTVEMNKIALSSNDDKRHVCDDGINTLAWGHYKLRGKRTWDEAFPP